MASSVPKNEVCPVESEGADGPLVIEPEVSRVVVAVVVALFGLLFSGIAGVILVANFDINRWTHSFCPGVFFLFGLAIDGLAAYFILKCFNPQPVVALSQRDVYPGSEFEVSWMFRGRVQSIRHLKVKLVGKEKVSYKQGTSTRTEESLFFEKTLIDTDDPGLIASGFELVELPANTMHSFKSSNNEIQWSVQVHGEIARWPDLDDVFPIRVITPPASELNHA